jgi:hypothetical protein
LLFKNNLRFKNLFKNILNLFKEMFTYNVIGFGVSFGAINGLYYIIKTFLLNFFSNKKIIILISGLKSILSSGFISSCGILFDWSPEGKERRLILSLYFLVRSLIFYYKVLIKYEYIR